MTVFLQPRVSHCAAGTVPWPGCLPFGSLYSGEKSWWEENLFYLRAGILRIRGKLFPQGLILGNSGGTKDFSRDGKE